MRLHDAGRSLRDFPDREVCRGSFVRGSLVSTPSLPAGLSHRIALAANVLCVRMLLKLRAVRGEHAVPVTCWVSGILAPEDNTFGSENIVLNYNNDTNTKTSYVRTLGKLYGEGQVIANDNTIVVDLFKPNTFQGGTMTSQHVSQDVNVFPFYSYTVNNIQTNLVFEYVYLLIFLRIHNHLHRLITYTVVQYLHYILFQMNLQLHLVYRQPHTSMPVKHNPLYTKSIGKST